MTLLLRLPPLLPLFLSEKTERHAHPLAFAFQKLHFGSTSRRHLMRAGRTRLRPLLNFARLPEARFICGLLSFPQCLAVTIVISLNYPCLLRRPFCRQHG
jgi:hypothetical protein